MRVYHDFFLVPGSRSTFPDADPAKWYGSDRIRIRNTGFYVLLLLGLNRSRSASRISPSLLSSKPKTMFNRSKSPARSKTPTREIHNFVLFCFNESDVLVLQHGWQEFGPILVELLMFYSEPTLIYLISVHFEYFKSNI